MWAAKDAIHRVAAKLGLAVIPTDPEGKPVLTPHILVPDSQTDSGMCPPPVPADGIDKLIEVQSSCEGGVQSSIHNPANAMVDNPPQPAPTPLAPPAADSTVELTA